MGESVEADRLSQVLEVKPKEVKSLIAELKEEREHWRDIIRIIDNEKTFDIASKVISKLLEKYGANSDNDYILEACKYYDIGLKFVPISYFSNINNLTTEEIRRHFNIEETEII